MYLLLAASPSLLMFPVLHKSTTCTEILFSVSASGGPKRRQGVPSRNGWTACALHSLIMPRLWQPPVGSLASTPLFPLGRGWEVHIRASLPGEMFVKGSPGWRCFLTSLSGILIGINSAKASTRKWSESESYSVVSNSLQPHELIQSMEFSRPEHWSG